MLGERTRPDASEGVASDVGLIDRWAAELTAIAYGTVPVAYGSTYDSVRAPRLTLVSSTDEPISIVSPDVPVAEPRMLPDKIVRLSVDVARDATIGQLARDIAAITQARDALVAAERKPVPAPKAMPQRAERPRPPVRQKERTTTQRQTELPAVMMALVPLRMGRTADSVPIILGSVLGFLMITIFSIAAVFMKFAR